MNEGRPLLATLAVCAILGAFGVSAYAVMAAHSSSSDVAAMRSKLDDVASRLDTLQRGNSALAGRVKSTEKQIKTREVGIAPLAKRVLKSVFTVETDQGLGTGFAAWREGGSTYVVTAYHVVKDQIGPYVVLRRKGGNWSAEIAGTDPKHDLAVLAIEGQPANAEPLWQAPVRKRPQTGDQLLLVGSPFGLEGTVTTGVVSRVTKKYVQTDAAANPGNSGGPALSKTGQIVGVLVAGGGQNINFVVPIEHVCVKLRSC